MGACVLGCSEETTGGVVVEEGLAFLFGARGVVEMGEVMADFSFRRVGADGRVWGTDGLGFGFREMEGSLPRASRTSLPICIRMIIDEFQGEESSILGSPVVITPALRIMRVNSWQ